MRLSPLLCSSRLGEGTGSALPHAMAASGNGGSVPPDKVPDDGTGEWARGWHFVIQSKAARS
jgi:hypothetical protein